MKTIFGDPIGWSRAAVGTWPRLWLIGAYFVALPFVAVDSAIRGGWASATGILILLVPLQLMFLYVLRRLSITCDKYKTSMGDG